MILGFAWHRLDGYVGGRNVIFLIDLLDHKVTVISLIWICVSSDTNNL